MSSIQDFAQALNEMSTASGRNAKKKRVGSVIQHSKWKPFITILAGQRFDNNGIASKTAAEAAARAFNVSEKVIHDEMSEEGTLTEALKANYGSQGGTNGNILDLMDDLYQLEDESGGDAIRYLAKMFRTYSHPHVVSYAVLNDWKFGVSQNTIASAAIEQSPHGHAYDKSDEKRGRALYPEMVEFVGRVMDGADITTPKVGQAFKPQLASSSDSQLEKVESDDDWVAQFKLDGHRSIIHVKDGEARAFSRALNEKTGVLPELEDVEWPEGEWILDAEVMARDGTYTSTSERLKSDPGREVLPNEMRFFLFDVIYAEMPDSAAAARWGTPEDGDTSTWEYKARYALLKDLDEHVEILDGPAAVIPHFTDVAQARKQAENYGYEGLILKNLEEPYHFGEREKEAWVKSKFTEETVDLRVKDIEEGTGRNAGRLGGLVLETEDGVAIGNVGTGFSDEDREHFWERDDLIVGQIVEVSFDAAAGYQDGLRFPRFEGLRPDKNHADDEERLREIAG